MDLKLKHWQLFIPIVVVPFFMPSFSVFIAIGRNDPFYILPVFGIVMLISGGFLLAWYYAMGTRLPDKLPDTVRMPARRFKIFLFTPLIYMVCFSIYIFSMAMQGQPPLPFIFFLILPLHFFSMFCIFYCFYFIGKTLKAVEWQREAGFNDYAGEFFLLWFFPIGIWLIQPRINRLFTEYLNTQPVNNESS